MRRSTLLLTAAVLFATASLSMAQSPTPAASPAASATPAKGHRQKKTTPAPTAAPAATAAAAAPAMTPATDASAAPVKKSRARKKAEKTEGTTEEAVNATPAPGGGPGMVWVNTKSHKYHTESSRYYGKTKEGKYLSEKDALAEGDKPVGNPKSDAPAKKP